MKAKTFKEYVSLRETSSRSVNRLAAKAVEPKIATVLISACRRGVPLYKHDGTNDSKIPKRHRSVEERMVGRRVRTSMDDLEQDLRDRGWGITKTVGGYPEDIPDSTEKNKVREPSFMASKTTEESPEQIIRQMVDLARDYDQDGVIVKLPGDREAHEYKPKEKISVPYGTPDLKKDPEFYTGLRKGQRTPKMTYTRAYSKCTTPFDPDNPSPPEE